MMGAKTIGCINHPGIEAVGRCRQCSKPVCKQCGVISTTGMYCSEVCRDKHEQFMKRAQALELDKRPKKNTLQTLRSVFGVLVILAVLLLAVGLVSTIFYIPNVSEFTVRVREMLGLI